MLADDWGLEGSGRVLRDTLLPIPGSGGEEREYGRFTDGRGAGGRGLLDWARSGDAGV